jgi:hypothetical protein
VFVLVFNDVYECTSSGRTGTPISTWVAYKALPILMSKPEIGGKKSCRKGCKRSIMSKSGMTELDTGKRRRWLICMALGKNISNNC